MTDIAPGRGPEFAAAEKAVLGSVIGNRARAEIVTGLLDRDDCFGDAEHQSVYAAVKWLTDEGGPVDAPSVLNRLVGYRGGGVADGAGGGDPRRANGARQPVVCGACAESAGRGADPGPGGGADHRDADGHHGRVLTRRRAGT